MRKLDQIFCRRSVNENDNEKNMSNFHIFFSARRVERGTPKRQFAILLENMPNGERNGGNFLMLFDEASSQVASLLTDETRASLRVLHVRLLTSRRAAGRPSGAAS